jgi:hypothetical protein
LGHECAVERRTDNIVLRLCVATTSDQALDVSLYFRDQSPIVYALSALGKVSPVSGD